MIEIPFLHLNNIYQIMKGVCSNVMMIWPQSLENPTLMHVNNKVSKGAKIRNRYNQVPHLTQHT